jgi:hypothetical protein
LFSLVQFTFEKRCLNIPAPNNSAGIGFEDLTKKEKKKKRKKSAFRDISSRAFVWGYTSTGS